MTPLAEVPVPKSVPQLVTRTGEIAMDLWNDSGNADALAKLYGRDLLYCIERKAFYNWDGRRWRYVDFRAVEALAERTLLYLKAQAFKITDEKRRKYYLGFINDSMNERGINAMIRLARKKVQCVSINEFDSNPWDLCVANGIVDLRRQELRPHDRESMCTKLIDITYDPKAPYEYFYEFLLKIMGAKEDPVRAEVLVRCLQRLFGCCATGVFEKMIVIFFGKGDNGKTSLLMIIAEALGLSEYAGEMLINSLMSHKTTDNATQSDVADLKGKRFVYSSEPEEGCEYALARLKYIMGGGTVRGRHLRENNVSFQPSHKLIIDCNEPPDISNSGSAVWNRISCIPFLVHVPKAEQTKDFKERLQAELPGILAWIVAGASLYFNKGLEWPAEVIASTNEIRLEADHFQTFLDDRIDRDAKVFTPLKEVAQASLAWHTSQGTERRIVEREQARLTKRLKQAGFTQTKPRKVNGVTTRCWAGLRLREGNRPTGISFNPSLAV